MIISILIIIGSMLVIWRASDGFEAASQYLGRNLSDGVRGATINAIGSSMPELFTTFIGLVALKNTDGFAFGVGTTAGSAIFNAMIIPAVVILAVIGKRLTNGVTLSRKVVLRDGLSLISVELILIFLLSGNTLSWWHGLILMLSYGAYLLVVFSSMNQEDNEDNFKEDEDSTDESAKTSDKKIFFSLLKLDLEDVFLRKGTNTINSWKLLIFSMIIIGIACAGLVHACETLALGMGIAPFFIAVILASAATSVPDTIISVRDAFDGEYDDAVANALGSNIFDVCFALGFPLFMYALIYGDITMNFQTISHIAELRGMLLLLTIATFLLFILNRKLKAIHGIALISFYAVFILYVLGRAYNHSWTDPISSFFHQLFL